ncbi:MAG: 2Fe-2S iron-sulfur cluster-binding protein [Solirubrobacteraceae bacterium]
MTVAEGTAVHRVTVDGAALDVAADATVLEAVRAAGRDVPTLCYDPRLEPFGACRVCLVGVDESPRPVVACTTPCRTGMGIRTDDRVARDTATAIVELILSELAEYPSEHTELAAVATGLGLTAHTVLRWPGERHSRRHDTRHPYLAFQHELCISCGRCVRACDEVQGAFALTATGRGFHANVTAGLDAGFRDSSCVSCGACADTCPTDAITEITLL